ncbi:MAG: hypothetical protein ACFB6R_16670 [Alphaproteobacteria bacterium]
MPTDGSSDPAPVTISVDLLALIGPVILAFVGYFVTYVLNILRRRANARFDYVSAQLRDLYGPLFSTVQSNSAAWHAFRKTFRAGEDSMYARPFDPAEREIWEAWAKNVFIPSNMRIKEIIEQNAHLLIDGEMPDCFRQMLAHVESSKIVLPALASGDLSVLDQFDDWPPDFNDVVERSYRTVAAEHAYLLGKSRGRRFLRRMREDLGSAPGRGVGRVRL